MDRYEIIGVLGKGSYGIVHKCKDHNTGEIVAVKKFIAGNDGKQVKKTFQREVTLLQVCEEVGRTVALLKLTRMTS